MVNPAAPSRIVLTCARPTGNLHLGNYLGAIRQWADLVPTHDCFFGIVDLHGITEPYKPADLRRSTYEMLALYIACGLHPEKCHLFAQSHVIGHTELAWVLSSLTPLGQLERMTQFKEKSQRGEGGFVSAGLLYYPVLMAADILLYNADLVPVGEDQKQHVELCRDLAEKFNKHYSETFTVPEVHIPQSGARIRSLQDPSKKMSKSDENPSGCLYLLDPPEVIRKKVASAVTDSEREIRFDPENKPGVANLLTILSACSGRGVEDWASELSGQNYVALKETVSAAVVSLLEPIQKTYHMIYQDKTRLEDVLRAGAEAAQKRASKTLSKVYRKAGFVERPR